MTERFILSPGDYISDDFRAKMQANLDEFFGSFEEAPAITALEPPRQRTERHVKRKRDLTDLLDSIKTTFDDLTLRADSMSWVASQTRIGLRKLGPHIPEYDWQAQTKSDWHQIFNDDEGPRPAVDPADLSTLIFIGFPNVAHGTDQRGKNLGENPSDRGIQEFIFAVRLSKLPLLVEAVPGQAYYQCGIVYRVTKKSLVWTSFYVVVGRDGSVHAARERYCTNHSVTTKAGGNGKKGRDRTTHNYARKKLGFQIAAGQKWGSMDEIELVLARKFANAVKWWGKKASMWSISVASRGDRVTFCIPPGEAKTYFRDRGRNALTPAGKRRPIFHVCREHGRELPDGRVVVVKEHSKGLREFNWQGYECAITAPTFHTVLSHAFNVPSLESDNDEIPKGMIDISKVGKVISDYELRPARLR